MTEMSRSGQNRPGRPGRARRGQGPAARGRGLAERGHGFTKGGPRITKRGPRIAKWGSRTAKRGPRFTKRGHAIIKGCPGITKRGPRFAEWVPRFTTRGHGITKRGQGLTRSWGGAGSPSRPVPSHRVASAQSELPFSHSYHRQVGYLVNIGVRGGVYPPERDVFDSRVRVCAGSGRARGGRAGRRDRRRCTGATADGAGLA